MEMDNGQGEKRPREPSDGDGESRVEASRRREEATPNDQDPTKSSQLQVETLEAGLLREIEEALRKHGDGVLEKAFLDVKEILKAPPVAAERAAAGYELLAPSEVEVPALWEMMRGRKQAIGVRCAAPFKNWGRTVASKPALTFFPNTVDGIKQIVNYAKSKNLSVRASGYRHSWSPVFPDDNQVLISMLPRDAEGYPANHLPIDSARDIEGIMLKGAEASEGKRLCRIGAATTNDQFRQWALNQLDEDLPSYTVPCNVIMVEITFGGSNAPLCHGSGLAQTTLSDLVKEVEFVDYNGELHIVNNADDIKAAAGCFGLLGIVTALTLELDKMTFADFSPKKVELYNVLPPPPNGKDYSLEHWQGRIRDVNGDAQKLINKLTNKQEEDYKKAFKGFLNHCTNNYYNEFFWFPYHEKCWVNVWNNTGEANGWTRYPGEREMAKQECYINIGRAMEKLASPLPGKVQAELFAFVAMLQLPGDDVNVKTPLIEALHFQRGIHNMPVRDFELEIPIPKLEGGELDWSVVQQAWWAVIQIVYDDEDAAMRVTLEMRIMGGSDMLMAAQAGNQATCSIEVLTNMNVEEEKWTSFKQKVLNAWAGLKDGQLVVRPHWAKEWAGLKVRGADMLNYLKEQAYKEQIPKFKNALHTIYKRHGDSVTAVQLVERFGNNMFKELLS